MPVLKSATASKRSRPGIAFTLLGERERGLLSLVKALRKALRSHIQPTALMAMAPVMNRFDGLGCSRTNHSMPEDMLRRANRRCEV
jgi:hypothetical protein